MSEAQDFVIRCTPDNPEYGSYRVRDASGEVEYYQDIDTAIAFAMEKQDNTRSRVSYTVEPARCPA